MDIARWLSSLGLAKYAETFSPVTRSRPKCFTHLSDADLEALGPADGPEEARAGRDRRSLAGSTYQILIRGRIGADAWRTKARLGGRTSPADA